MKLVMRLFKDNEVGIFVKKQHCHSVNIPSDTHWRVAVGVCPIDDPLLDCPMLVSKEYSYLEATLREGSAFKKLMTELDTNVLEVTMNGTVVHHSAVDDLQEGLRFHE